MGAEAKRLTPIEHLKEVQIGIHTHQVTIICISLSAREEHEIVARLRINADLFAWPRLDILEIDIKFVSHLLAIHPFVKLVAQRKWKVHEEKRVAVNEEIEKLSSVRFITETKYPTWLANMVLVQKANHKWRMFLDYTNLNAACPKDLYPLPYIYCLNDGSSGYCVLSFMDSYSEYKQIKMDPLEVHKTALMSNHDNYYYNVTPFGLKNADDTYQWLMDDVFTHHMKQNLKIYVNDMFIKTAEEHNHVNDLEDILRLVKKYD